MIRGKSFSSEHIDFRENPVLTTFLFKEDLEGETIFFFSKTFQNLTNFLRDSNRTQTRQNKYLFSIRLHFAIFTHQGNLNT